ncbi:MAG: hypothetical protein CVT48_03090 [Thermoplasmata archaeon HGW-Thermoplasmata-1]|nr:MAG: hypothetical protein CVT48_03090 [Thermoplasmata archaeon HGW-Thermoplasmata-1]
MPVYEYGNLKYRTHPEVYEPSDDTFLLLNNVSVNSGESILEMGCGSGLVAVSLAMRGAKVTAVDVNPRAVELTSGNARLNGISVRTLLSNFFDNVEKEPFDVVVFNPPYLPTAGDEHLPGHLDKAFDGGECGNEATLDFVRRLGDWMHVVGRRPRLYLLFSSLNDADAISKTVFELGYKTHRVVARESHFFEKLSIHLFEGEN